MSGEAPSARAARPKAATGSMQIRNGARSARGLHSPAVHMAQSLQQNSDATNLCRIYIPEWAGSVELTCPGQPDDIFVGDCPRAEGARCSIEHIAEMYSHLVVIPDYPKTRMATLREGGNA